MSAEHEQDCQDGCDDQRGRWCGQCEDAVAIMQWTILRDDREPATDAVLLGGDPDDAYDVVAEMWWGR